MGVRVSPAGPCCPREKPGMQAVSQSGEPAAGRWAHLTCPPPGAAHARGRGTAAAAAGRTRAAEGTWVRLAGCSPEPLPTGQGAPASPSWRGTSPRAL